MYCPYCGRNESVIPVAFTADGGSEWKCMDCDIDFIIPGGWMELIPSTERG